MVNWRKLLDLFLESLAKAIGYATGVLIIILLITLLVLILIQDIDISLEKIEAFGILAAIIAMLALLFRENTSPPRRYW